MSIVSICDHPRRSKEQEYLRAEHILSGVSEHVSQEHKPQSIQNMKEREKK